MDLASEIARLQAVNQAQQERIARQSERLNAYRTQIDITSEAVRTDPLAMLSGHEINGILHSLHDAAKQAQSTRCQELAQELKILFDSAWVHQNQKFAWGGSPSMYPIEEFDLGVMLDKGPLHRLGWHPKVTATHSLGGVMVKTCRLPLQLAVRTLLSNAIRALDESGKLELTYDPESCLLTFADNGPGVEDPSLLFTSLVNRNPQSSNDKSLRYGIGLLSARESLRKTGGDLWHTPSEVGACFTIRLGSQPAV